VGEECRAGSDFEPPDILAKTHPVDVLTIKDKRYDIGFNWCLGVARNVN
jgi:hypothetical protein